MDEAVVTREMERAGEAIIDHLYGAVGSDYLARCVYIAMAEIAPHEQPSPVAEPAGPFPGSESQRVPE